MHSYKLVNPVIIGKLNTKIDAEDENKAATGIWKILSKYIAGDVPRFGFTIKDDKDKLYHFLVSETKNKDDIDIVIEKLDIKMTKEQEHKFINNIDNVVKQNGGSRLDGHLFNYIQYNPLVYNYEYIYLPLFTIPIMPYIEISVNDIFAAANAIDNNPKKTTINRGDYL